MTQQSHYTTAATYTVPTGITRIRPVVAGGVGGLDSFGQGTPGRGAILSALIAATAGSTFAVTFRNGGAKGSAKSGSGGVGGRAAVFADIIAGAGGGCGTGSPGDGGVPGQDAPAATGTTGTQPTGGKADGSGGTGGINSGYPSGSAGQANGSGGTGGNAASTAAEVFPAGGGGAGFGGGGGGSIAQSGAGGSSSGGTAGATLVDYNTGAPYVDVFCASVPLVPTLITPIGNAYVDRTQPIVLTFQHNGASTDALDAQSDAAVRHRKVGAATWTTVTGLGTATSYAIPAGTYADGDQVEWQASTWSDGLQGPWSASEYFRAATRPATPVFTSPTTGQVFGTAAVGGAWTHPGQVMYQYRIVNDVSGSAGTLVYADSGPVTSAALSTTLTVKINTVSAHAQLQVRDVPDGLWSLWADVPISISWEPPATPIVYQRPDPEHGSIVMVIANPAPTGTQPAPTVNRVYVTEGGTESRRAVIAPDADYEYWVPVGEVGVRVEAVDESTGVLSSTEVIW